MLTHIIIIATYAIVSVLIVLLAPGIVTGMGKIEAIIYGCVVFVVGVQLHIFYIWYMGKEDTTYRLLALHQDYQVAIERFDENRNELELLRTNISQASTSNNSEILSEMRVLQTLLNQVAEKSSKSLSDHLNQSGDLSNPAIFKQDQNGDSRSKAIFS